MKKKIRRKKSSVNLHWVVLLIVAFIIVIFIVQPDFLHTFHASAKPYQEPPPPKNKYSIQIKNSESIEAQVPNIFITTES